MTATVVAISIDTADAAKLADFWSDLLGVGVGEGATPQSASIPASDSSPQLLFHQVPEGKSVKNRLHLDLLSNDFEPELNRILELGATRLNELRRAGAHWVTLADPEGNEFDLISGSDD
jgi:predicted enzyme related to lactoylglutathione lyase